ncbi:MAG: ribonuclease HII [Candidatus Pacearchaeota archaeon]
MEILFLGIDEAGRGPVIGPMVLAGCLADSKTLEELKKIGVKDSKQLTQRRREFLEKRIKEIVRKFEIVVLDPELIDTRSKKWGNLNELEAVMAAEIINKLNEGSRKIRVILDCPSPSPDKWRNLLKNYIKNRSNLEIVCEHKADINHVIVSAASILAKCQREREMEKIKKIYGEDVGSGYGSDPRTKKFLEENADSYSDKNFFRKTWASWKRASSNLKQKKLFE